MQLVDSLAIFRSVNLAAGEPRVENVFGARMIRHTRWPTRTGHGDNRPEDGADDREHEPHHGQHPPPRKSAVGPIHHGPLLAVSVRRREHLSIDDAQVGPFVTRPGPNSDPRGPEARSARMAFA